MNYLMKIKLKKILVVLFAVFCSFFAAQKVNADTVTTSVTVGNSLPTITVTPAESTESSSSTPTNVGSNVTWTVTATDSNSENYYLAVCSTNAVTPTNGGAPTCNATQYCVSSSTASGAQATCNRTALVGDSEVNAWYAFVCDGNASSASCSASGNQGTGATGSPFEVNHAPGFTVYAEDGPDDPGGNIIFTSTAADTDTSAVSDTVTLVVCKTTGISAGDCDGGPTDRWCVSSASASNPTCTYTLPTPTADAAYNAYGYVLDSHNFGSTSGTQGSNDAFTVNNIAPVVSSVSINSGAAIDLTEGTTTGVVLGATVTDNNGCSGGELATVYGYAYRSDLAFAGCDTAGESNSNRCYSEVTCSVSGASCTGATDASATYECTANIQYYADPTDTATLYPGSNWLSTVKVTDDDTLTHNTQVASGVEMNSLTALDVTASINYGSLNIGESNDPLDKVTTVTPTGNVGIDTELYGPAFMCTDYPTCAGNTIAINYVKYALSTSTAYASGASLSTTPTEVELNVPKDITGSPTTKDIWWGIQIPTGTVPGSYTGANTVGAYKGETGGW